MKKKQIAETTWQIILRSGMKGVTVRNVASEAGMSLGSLRHYFPTQDELLDYMIEHAQNRYLERAESVKSMNLPIKEKAFRFFCLLLPVDEVSCATIDVWLSYITHLYQTKSFYTGAPDCVYGTCEKFFSYLNDCGALKTGLDLRFELNRLLSLIDGMSIHALVMPNRKSPEEIKDMLRLHLESLFSDNGQINSEIPK